MKRSHSVAKIALKTALASLKRNKAQYAGYFTFHFVFHYLF